MGNTKLLISTIILIILSTNLLNAEEIKGHDKVDPVLEKQLHSVLEQQRNLNGIPGISAAVIGKDQKWLGTFGYSAEKVSIYPEMLFGSGSVSKIYIAALILKLVEEKILSLDDPISRWLSKKQFIDSAITIRQLLNHTSGLYRYQGTPKWFGAITTNDEKHWKPEEILETFVSIPVDKPGIVWGESAADYVLLGMIIEKAIGQKVVELLREKIITPLNLKHTYLYPDETFSSEELAHFWWDVNRTGKLVDVFPLESKVPLSSMFSSVWTSGAILSTAEDLAVFTKALFEGKVLSGSSLEQMLTPIKIEDSPEYGFSVIIDTIDGKIAYWHTGGIGYSSVFYYIAENKLSVTVLCNSLIDPKPIAVELYKSYCVHKNSKD